MLETLLTYLKKQPYINIFTIYLRFIIGAAFVFSSVVKTKADRFIGVDGSEFPINSMPHFFETLYQSGVYWQFIGFSQLVAGLLLMTQRFTTIGAIVFYPIILNIFFITLSYDFRGTPIITGLMLLANTFLLLWDFDRLKFLFIKVGSQSNYKPNYTNPIETMPLWVYLGFFLFLTSVLSKFLNVNPKYWIWFCILEGFVGFIMYLHTRNKQILLANVLAGNGNKPSAF